MSYTPQSWLFLSSPPTPCHYHAGDLLSHYWLRTRKVRWFIHRVRFQSKQHFEYQCAWIPHNRVVHSCVDGCLTFRRPVTPTHTSTWQRKKKMEPTFSLSFNGSIQYSKCIRFQCTNSTWDDVKVIIQDDLWQYTRFALKWQKRHTSANSVNSTYAIHWT